VDAAELERRALEELRKNDLDGARGTLTALLQLRPRDQRLRERIAQIDRHIAKRNEMQAQIRADPLRYAKAYIQAGRLAEGLQLLRQVLAQDPDNHPVRELALDVARRLRQAGQSTGVPEPATPSAGSQAPRAFPEAAPIRQEREAAEARARAEEAARQEWEAAEARARAEEVTRAPSDADFAEAARPQRPVPFERPVSGASASEPGQTGRTGFRSASRTRARLEVLLQRIRSRRRSA
jgi:tetratricopeptide (TPR) repeat protein